MAQAAPAAGVHGVQPRTVTTVALALGANKAPAVACMLEQCDAWMDACEAASAQQRRE